MLLPSPDSVAYLTLLLLLFMSILALLGMQGVLGIAQAIFILVIN